MGDWTRCLLPEPCGSCSKAIPRGAVVWTFQVTGGPRRIRCRDCGESMAGYCLLKDPPDVPDLPSDSLAPQPALFEVPSSTSQDFVTAGQLLAWQQRRAKAIARARERARRR